MRRAARTLCTASVWASFVLAGEPARADGAAQSPAAASGASAEPHPGSKSDTDAQPPTAAASAASADGTSDTEQAADAVDHAMSLYASRELVAALKLMRETYRRWQRPELLYNLALIERDLKECKAALADYRGYLQGVPDGAYRVEAGQAAGELEHECPGAAAAPNPALAQPSPTREPAGIGDQPSPGSVNRDAAYWTPPRVIGWSAIAAGVAAESGMLYFWLAAKNARNDYQNAVNAYRSGPPPETSPQDREHRDLTAAQVLAVAGGALITGGALVLILGPHDPNPGPANAFLYLPPGGIGAGYAGSF